MRGNITIIRVVIDIMDDEATPNRDNVRPLYSRDRNISPRNNRRDNANRTAPVLNYNNPPRYNNNNNSRYFHMVYPIMMLMIQTKI